MALMLCSVSLVYIADIYSHLRCSQIFLKRLRSAVCSLKYRLVFRVLIRFSRSLCSPPGHPQSDSTPKHNAPTLSHTSHAHLHTIL